MDVRQDRVAALAYSEPVSGWIAFFGALLVLLITRLTVYRLFGAAWKSGRLTGRGAGALLAVIAGIVPLAAGLWLTLFSANKLPGVLLLAIWLVAYLPWAIALIGYMERSGVRVRSGRSPPPTG